MDEASVRRLVETYADMILRISFHYLGSSYDAEDICQTVFLKLLKKEPRFADAAHEKAWIIRATINACKDHLRSSFLKRCVGLEAAGEVADDRASVPEEASEVLDALRCLPEKYRTSLYLYYYEGYSAREIGALYGRSENAAAAWLSRGRRKLRTLLEQNGYAEGMT